MKYCYKNIESNFLIYLVAYHSNLQDIMTCTIICQTKIKYGKYIMNIKSVRGLTGQPILATFHTSSFLLAHSTSRRLKNENGMFNKMNKAYGISRC